MSRRSSNAQTSVFSGCPIGLIRRNRRSDDRSDRDDQPMTKMYVRENYDKEVDDEITVKCGDHVFLRYIDRTEEGDDWAYISTQNNVHGFVPRNILIKFDDLKIIKRKKIINKKFNGLNTMETAFSNTSSDKECNRLPKEMTSPPSNDFNSRHPSHHRSFHNLHSNRLFTDTNHNFSQTMRPGEILRHHHHHHQHHHSKDHDYLNNHLVHHDPQAVLPRINHPCQNQLMPSAPATVIISPTSHRNLHHHQNLLHMLPSQQHSPNDLADSYSNGCNPHYNNFHPTLFEYHHTNDPIPETYRKDRIGEYIVLFNFTAMAENDISVEPLEIVNVWNKDDPDWYWISRKIDRSEGFVPSQFICEKTKYYDQYQKLLVSEQRQPTRDHFIDNQCSNGHTDFDKQIIYQNQDYQSPE